MSHCVESVLREYTQVLLDRIEETIQEYLPLLKLALTNDTEFDAAMLRMRDALARNEELSSFVKEKEERIEKLEVLLGRYREISRYLCGKWDVCEYCDLKCDGRGQGEPCELWNLERELGDER